MHGALRVRTLTQNLHGLPLFLRLQTSAPAPSQSWGRSGQTIGTGRCESTKHKKRMLREESGVQYMDTTSATDVAIYEHDQLMCATDAWKPMMSKDGMLEAHDVKGWYAAAAVRRVVQLDE